MDEKSQQVSFIKKVNVHEDHCAMFVPGVSCSVVRRVFDAVSHWVHLAILHDHLHAECGLALCKHALLHSLKENDGFLHWSISPW